MLPRRVSGRLERWCVQYLVGRSLERPRPGRVPTLDALAASHARHEVDVDDHDREILDAVGGLALVNELGILSLIQAVEYLVRRDVPGDLVECGSYLGGAAVAMAMKLRQLDRTDRDIVLFDTFEGMPEPERPADRLPYRNRTIGELFEEARASDELSHAWFRDVEAETRSNLAATGYPMDRVHLVRGRVEETIPERAPATVSLLRLDTDWYESTRHELVHLYPRLAVGGVLIVDDYGILSGARDATEEYFRDVADPVLLHRVNASVRQAIKV